MHTILISYDLKRPGQNYQNLWDHLKSYGSWAKPVESVYLIKTGLSAEGVRNNILSHIDTNDKVIVIDVTSKASAWRNLAPEVSTWITNNL